MYIKLIYFIEYFTAYSNKASTKYIPLIYNTSSYMEGINLLINLVFYFTDTSPFITVSITRTPPASKDKLFSS